MNPILWVAATAVSLVALSSEATAATNDVGVVAHCELRVDGKTLLDGPCPVCTGGDHSITMNLGQKGVRPTWFAYISADKDGSSEASWNQDKGSLHAGAKLGKVAHQGDCWTNERTRICISQ